MGRNSKTTRGRKRRINNLEVITKLVVMHRFGSKLSDKPSKHNKVIQQLPKTFILDKELPYNKALKKAITESNDFIDKCNCIKGSLYVLEKKKVTTKITRLFPNPIVNRPIKHTNAKEALDGAIDKIENKDSNTIELNPNKEKPLN